MISALYVKQLLPDAGKKFLERAGNLTVTTTNPAIDALKLLETNTFDAILPDYKMPGVI